jgi:carnosine N-methyltransferase
MNYDKVKSILKLFARDWSAFGEHERTQCYGPLLDALARYKPIVKGSEGTIDVLVPGAGLGRLAWECVLRGYNTQGNEFSYFCLICSSFILNHNFPANTFQIYPYIHQSHNIREFTDQIRAVNVPDVPPSDVPRNAEFSMVAGDFLQVYDDPNAWDAVLTCFFIDTAKNIIAYVEKIREILKPDGVWINIGPLLYHYADMPGETSIELTYAELKQVMVHYGFQIQEERWVTCRYCDNGPSMYHVEYECVFFVATMQSPAPIVVAHSSEKQP